MKKSILLAIGVSMLCNTAVLSSTGTNNNKLGYYDAAYDATRKYVDMFGSYTNLKRDETIRLVHPSLQAILRDQNNNLAQNEQNAESFAQTLKSIMWDTPSMYHEAVLKALFEERTLTLEQITGLRKIYKRHYGLFEGQTPKDDGGLSLAQVQSYVASLPAQTNPGNVSQDLRDAVNQPPVSGQQDQSAGQTPASAPSLEDIQKK